MQAPTIEGTSVGGPSSVAGRPLGSAVWARVAGVADGEDELEGAGKAAAEALCRERTWRRGVAGGKRAGSEAGEGRHTGARGSPRLVNRVLSQRRRTENLRVALSALSPNRLSYIAIAASMSSRC